MFERFGMATRQAILAASEEASGLGAPRIGTEHLLVGLVSVGVDVDLGLTVADARAFQRELDARALQAVGIDVEPPTTGGLAQPGGQRFVFGRSHLPFTSAAKGSLERALRIAIDEKHRRITPTHVLAAIATGGGNDPAVRLLRVAGIDPSWLDAAIRRSWREAS